ncbi:glycosyltransferase [Prochlorococcus marinus]|uniref:glycosyltransferase n=1 Tax=Prochlorococcus marinus TaxID=1219 RepID=UPI001ADB5A53|nr:glycosyltransferase [Prochlorococcus marinus]MBO8219554.1 glycosyltransferase family 4 protein [Prochlorococcus marinus CUG1416]MBW3051925.1 hypothetical protein [Prochlorococcus marinus str. MU1416]
MQNLIIIDNSRFISLKIRIDLFKRLSKDYKVKLYYLREDSKIKENIYISDNFSTQRLGLITFIKLITQIYRTDKILTFTIRPLIIGFLLKHICPRLSLYPTITGTGPLIDSNNWIYKCLRFFYPIILSSAQHIFFHNRDDANYLTKKNKKQNFTITGGSGIEISQKKSTKINYKIPENIPKIACFSRLIIDKGILHYLKATEIIFKEYPFMKDNIYLAGIKYKGNFKNNTLNDSDLQKWEKAGGIYIGQPSNVKAFYSSIDIICLPSFREGLSNVLLEAGNADCLLMSTNVPGCIDIIENDCGIVFEPRSTESLYKALKKVIFLPINEQIKFKNNLFEKNIKKFSKQRVIQDYLNIIN